MKKLIRPLFIVYAVIMLWLLFGQRLIRADFTDYAQKLSQNINLVPMQTVKLFSRLARYSINVASVDFALRNLVGNVLLFIPLGALPLLYPKLCSFRRFILTVAAVIVTVEIVQFLTLLGSCDVDDLILNLFGASVGYCLVRLMFKNLFCKNEI